MIQLLGRSWPEMFVERLGWVLVHSLWQILLVSAVAVAIVRLLAGRSAAARYWVLLTALAVCAIIPCIMWTALRLDDVASSPSNLVSDSSFAARPSPADEPSVRTTHTPSLVRTTPAGTSPLYRESDAASTDASQQSLKVSQKLSWSDLIKSVLRPWLPVIVLMWIVGVVICSLRPLLGWYMLRRLQLVGLSAVSEEILAALRRVSARLGIRQAVRVMQSAVVQVPVVVGYLRPVILLPGSLATSLPCDQLEAILAHELVHVMRHDFVLNLLQTLVETLFFYHPAVWWLSYRIRIEREHCCDDRVVSSLDNRLVYGRALLAVEELRGQSALLALGAGDGSMLSRLRRILGQDSVHLQSSAARQSGRWPATLVCLATVILIVTASVHRDVQAKAETGKADETKTPDANPFVIKLPDGLSVELLGVAEMSKEPAAWWRPDGTALKSIPPHHGSALKPATAAERRAVVRVHGVKDPKDVISNYAGVRMDFARQAEKDSVLCDARLFPPQGQKLGRLEIGVATEPLSRLRYAEMQKKAPLPNDKAADLVAEDLEDIEIFGTKSANAQPGDQEGIAIAFKTPVSGAGQIDLEMKCRDIDGNLHEVKQISSNGSAAARQTQTYWFNVPTKKAAWIEYRLRMFRDWVVFENVSLDLNQQTDVRVTVVSQPQSDAAKARQQIDAIADRFVAAMKTLKLPYVDDDILKAMRRELRDELVNRISRPVSAEWLKQVLAAVEIHCRDVHYQRFRYEKRFMIDFETLKWHLWTALDRDELTPDELAQRESQRQWFRDFARTLPDPTNGQVARWAMRNGSVIESNTLDFKLNELEEVMTDPLNPYFAWPLEDKAFEKVQSEVKNPRWLVSRQPTLGGIASLVGHPMAQEQSRLACRRWPLESFDGVNDGFGKSLWSWDGKRAERTLASLKADQQGRDAGLVAQQTSVESVLPEFKLPDRLNVMAVGFRREGQELVSLATEHVLTARQWDLSKKVVRHEATLESDLHASRFLMGRLTLSADCQRAAAIVDGDVCLWETSTGKLLKRLKSPLDPPTGIASNLTCTPDFSFVACSYWSTQTQTDSLAVVWDASSGQVMQTVQHIEPNRTLNSLALTSNGQRLATGGRAAVRVWEVATGNLQLEIPNTNPGLKHSDPKASDEVTHRIVCLAFSPDGQQLAMGDLLGVKLIDTKTGDVRHRLPAPFSRGLSSLIFSKDSQLVARVATDRTVPIWSTKSGQLVDKLMAETNAGAFSEDGKWFATGVTDEKKGIGVWRLSDKR